MTRDREPSNVTGLDELVRGLPRAVEPPPDLWLGIAARLDAPGPRGSLEQRARDLPGDIAPPADLWPQIEARLRTERHRPRAPALVAAAAAVVVVAAGIWVALAVRDGGPSAGGRDSTARVAPNGGGDDAASSTALGAAWMLQSPAISEEVAATLKRELALVHNERLKIETAIESEPDDSGLRELWAHTYQAELRLTDAWSRTIMAYEIG
jgi:hypothetical protein